MLRFLISRRLDREERRMGASLDYLRFILQHSVKGFFRFAKIFSIATFRAGLPQDVRAVAQLVATQDEDCGTCVQIVVNLALQDGVPPEVIQAVVDRAPDRLPESLALIHAFAKGVVEADGSDVALRPKVLERYGERGLIELGMAMATARFYPIVKRTLGYAVSCQLVQVELQQGNG